MRVIEQMGNRVKELAKRLLLRTISIGNLFVKKLKHLTKKQQRIGATVAAAVLLLSFLIPTLQYYMFETQYQLSDAAWSLVSKAPGNLASKLTYNAKTDSYEYNQSAQSTPPQMAKIGGNFYAVSAPTDISKGVTYRDINSQLSFTMVPKFQALTAKQEQGHLVYPIGGGAEAVYTLKDNGLKEDIVVNKATSDTMSFSYQLDLPKSLEAHQLSDGSIAIYGPDQSLFGNISYGSDKDKALVEKAREKAAKTSLMFIIPASTITTSPGDKAGNASAQFSLHDSTLTVTAKGLNQLTKPFSIDPSVVVQSANSFNLGNNEDPNAIVATSSVARAAITGGSLSGSWSVANTGAAFTARTSPGVTVYNGYMYVVGGALSSTTQTNTVYFASVNSNGTLGAWAATSNSFINARMATNAIAYNGYLYMIAGVNINNSSFDDAQYAVICTGKNTGVGGCTSTPGDVGTWLYANGTATQAGSTGVDGSKLNVAAGYAATAAYSGRVYVMGGCSANPVSGCAVANSTTQVASFQANGTLSVWTNSSAGLPTSSRVGGTAVAYNNFMYLMGGCTSGYSLGICQGSSTTIYIAPITNGVLGTWVASSVAAPSTSLNVTVYDGYLYYQSDGTPSVGYSQIYANGQLGSLGSTTAYSSARYNDSNIAYNGYLYLIGGSTSNAAGNNNQTSDVEYIPINKVGPTGSWVTSGNTITANGLMSAATVIYGGYIYLLGGTTSSGTTFSNSVYYAKLGSDGSVGTWATTSAFTTPRASPAAVASNGYMYIVGGNTSTTTDANCPVSGTVRYCEDMQYAPIMSNGTLGSWTSAGANYSTVNGRDGLGAAIYNGYIYVIGGNYNSNSNTSAEIDIAQLGSSGTITGSWTVNTTTLASNNISNFGLAQMGQYLYLVGGRSGGSNQTTTTLYLKLASSGGVSLPSPQPTQNFTTARSFATAGVVNGYLYVASGWKSGSGLNGLNDVQYIQLNTSTGALTGNWAATQSFTTTRAYQMGGIYNGYLYIAGGCNNLGIIGGCNSTPQSDVQYTPLNNGGGGSSGAWSSTTNMATNRGAFGSMALNGYLYIIGGCGSAACLLNSETATVYHVPINPDGSLGATWTADTSLPTNGRAAFGITTYNGAIYVLGGALSSGAFGDNSVVYAIPNSANGNITSWTTTTSFTAPRQYLAAAAYNGYIYISGGVLSAPSTICNTTSSSTCDDIQYAPINSNGSLGAWHFTHSSTDDGTTFVSGFPTPRSANAMQIINGYMYILGGWDTSNNPLGDVQYAQLNSNGTVGTWNATTSMTMPRANSILTAIYGGYLYAYTGNTGTNSVEYAPILSGGTLGSWSLSNTLASGNAATYGYMSGAIANGYLYAMGGQSGSTVSNTVQYTPIQVQPRIAHYSYLVDLKSTANGGVGGDPQVTRFALKYTPASAGSAVSICWQGATTAAPSGNNVLGTRTCTSNPSSGVPITWRNYGRYAWTYITLDDTLSATFPDASQTTVNELDTYFHAAPARRLRGGQTFTDLNVSGGTQNQLDTEGSP